MRYTQARISAEDLKKISFFCDVETEKRGVRVTKTMALHEMIDFFLKENKEFNINLEGGKPFYFGKDKFA